MTKMKMRRPFMPGGNYVNRVEQARRDLPASGHRRLAYVEHSREDCGIFCGLPFNCDPTVYVITLIDAPR